MIALFIFAATRIRRVRSTPQNIRKAELVLSSSSVTQASDSSSLSFSQETTRGAESVQSGPSLESGEFLSNYAVYGGPVTETAPTSPSPQQLHQLPVTTSSSSPVNEDVARITPLPANPDPPSPLTPLPLYRSERRAVDRHGTEGQSSRPGSTPPSYRSRASAHSADAPTAGPPLSLDTGMPLPCSQGGWGCFGQAACFYSERRATGLT